MEFLCHTFFFWGIDASSEGQNGGHNVGFYFIFIKNAILKNANKICTNSNHKQR